MMLLSGGDCCNAGFSLSLINSRAWRLSLHGNMQESGKARALGDYGILPDALPAVPLKHQGNDHQLKSPNVHHIPVLGPSTITGS